MSEKITSTLDPRIAADVEARNRVQTQMDALLAKEGEDFTADDLAAVQSLQTEFDGLTERILVKQRAAESAADRDFTNALLEETRGLVQAGDVKPPSDRQVLADEAIYQNMAQSAASPFQLPMVTKLRGQVMADLHKIYDASPSMREVRQLWMGQAGGDSPVQQDVIGRIAGTGVEAIGRADHSIIPQGVEATFVEVLRNINGPHKAGCEVWYTADLAPTKLPKAVPAAAREPGSTAAGADVPAERGPDDAMREDIPEFTFVNTQVREYSALFPVDRSVENTTPAMIGSKVGELLARNLGAQVSRNATIGNTATTAEGILPDATVANKAAVTTARAWISGDFGFTASPAGGAVTYQTIMSIMGALLDYPMVGGMGDVWMAHKSYVFSNLIGMRGTDGHPIFKSMGVGDTAPVDTLMGRPIVYSDYAPAANTNNRLMLVFGNFYGASVCRRAGDIELATDMGGRYFQRNQVAYRGLMYEAFVIKNPQLLSYLRGTT